LGDYVEIAIDEFTQSPVIVYGSGTGAPCDVQFEPGNAEGILNINQHETDGQGILIGRL